MKKLLLVLMLVTILTPQVQASQNINLNAIAKIESGGCKSPCIGDAGRSLGAYQIQKAVIEDWNKEHPRQKKAHSCALEPVCATQIANWYLHIRIPKMLKFKGVKDTLENRLICYNAGISALTKGKKIPKTTLNYIKKYKKIVGK